MKKLRLWMLGFVLALLLVPNVFAYASEGEEIANTPTTGSESEPAGPYGIPLDGNLAPEAIDEQKQTDGAQPQAETATQDTENAVNNLQSLSPVFMPPEATEEPTAIPVSETVAPLPSETPEPASAPTNETLLVQFSVPAEREYGVIVLRQVDGQWQATQSHFYDSALSFVLLCAVVLLVAILIFIVGVYFIGKPRR